LVALVIGLPTGIIAALGRGRPVDTLVMLVAIIGVSMPSFWLGLSLIYVFAVSLRWLPLAGYQGLDQGPGEALRYLIMPAITLGLAQSALLARMTRSMMLETLGEDYVRTARAKGLSERKVVYKHVLKNGLIPVVTILGLQLGVLLAGAIITEKIFSWQGLGLLLLEDGIAKRDYRLVQGCVLVISVTYILANSLTDFVYRRLDPRIRLS
jgi:peptide/nickel transport system permease protein